jgi:Protein of unknown function (DUF1152)
VVLRSALHQLAAGAGAVPQQVAAGNVEPYLPALECHPSEATTLFAAAALGVVGKAEIRDRGALVPVSDANAAMWVLPARTLITVNKVAAKLVDVHSFVEGGNSHSRDLWTHRIAARTTQGGGRRSKSVD